ncbi:hypothetical protein C1645_782937 [Glomus cerebriforme]|uniref:Uncharacterized protein n=1 Tax=Glomus cerebriforme TaxID=658196 RepID=A0A397SLJ5_9GLOM|nr:hypothetical protein C1645_782937 [Glomus cerebriforme]
MTIVNRLLLLFIMTSSNTTDTKLTNIIFRPFIVSFYLFNLLTFSKFLTLFVPKLNINKWNMNMNL